LFLQKSFPMLMREQQPEDDRNRLRSVTSIHQNQLGTVLQRGSRLQVLLSLVRGHHKPSALQRMFSIFQIESLCLG